MAEYAVNYPFLYQADERILLSPYMTLPGRETLEIINEWTDDFLQCSEKIETYSLLQRLADCICQTLSYRIREDPGVQTAIETLSCGTGSCRNFALLFMKTARCLGLASRFVSGYLHAPLMAHKIGATHAWAEVYLPGAVSKGFDPTIGKMAENGHMAVAVARLAESVPPIEKTFAGAQSSKLDVGVWVSKC